MLKALTYCLKKRHQCSTSALASTLSHVGVWFDIIQPVIDVNTLTPSTLVYVLGVDVECLLYG